MPDDDNIVEKAAKSTGSFLDENITGSLGHLTDQAAHKYGTLGSDEVNHDKANQAKGVLPWVAGGAATLIGVALLQPINWAVKGGFSLVKELATGFGLFEKIPLIGGLFTALGKGIQTVGEYAGFAVPAIAGFIGYKAFQSKEGAHTSPTPSSLAAKMGTDPAMAAAVPVMAAAALAGHRSTGMRQAVIRTIVSDPGGKTPATTKQVNQLRTQLGDDGFNRVHRAMFDADPVEGKPDSRLTKPQASKLIHQIKGMEGKMASARATELAEAMPRRGVARALVNKTPIVSRIAGWVSPDAGLSRAERRTAGKVEVAKPPEQAAIQRRIATQITEDVAAVRGKPGASTAIAEHATSRYGGAGKSAEPIGFHKQPATSSQGSGKPATSSTNTTPTETPAAPARSTSPSVARAQSAQARLLPQEPVATSSPSARATPSPGSSTSTGTTTATTGSNTTGTPPPSKQAPAAPSAGRTGFVTGGIRPGYTAAGGATAILGSAFVITSDKATGFEKGTAATGGGLLTVSSGSHLLKFTNTASVLGKAGGAAFAPLSAYNAVQSFTKKDATARDYIDGSISTGYTAGAGMLLTPAAPAGLVVLAGSGIADIGHKGYQIYDLSSQTMATWGEIDGMMEEFRTPDTRGLRNLRMMAGKCYYQSSTHQNKGIQGLFNKATKVERNEGNQSEPWEKSEYGDHWTKQDKFGLWVREGDIDLANIDNLPKLRTAMLAGHKEAQARMGANDSWTPRWLRSGESVSAYATAQSDIATYDAALGELTELERRYEKEIDARKEQRKQERAERRAERADRRAQEKIERLQKIREKHAARREAKQLAKKEASGASVSDANVGSLESPKTPNSLAAKPSRNNAPGIGE